MCVFDRGRRGGGRDHAGARRRRSDDRGDAPGEHGRRRREQQAFARVSPTGEGRLAARRSRRGEFAVTGEIVPPRCGQRRRGHAARPRSGRATWTRPTSPTTRPPAPHMSPARRAPRSSREPGSSRRCSSRVRDRNRLALTADLLGAWALGARNVLCLTGDPMRRRSPRRDGGRTICGAARWSAWRKQHARRWDDAGAGAEIADPPRYLIGVADVPLADPYDPAKLEDEARCRRRLRLDADRLRRRRARRRGRTRCAPRGLFERAKVIVGVVAAAEREAALGSWTRRFRASRVPAAHDRSRSRAATTPDVRARPHDRPWCSGIREDRRGSRASI